MGACMGAGSRGRLPQKYERCPESSDTSPWLRAKQLFLAELRPWRCLSYRLIRLLWLRRQKRTREIGLRCCFPSERSFRSTEVAHGIKFRSERALSLRIQAMFLLPPSHGRPLCHPAQSTRCRGAPWQPSRPWRI